MKGRAGIEVEFWGVRGTVPVSGRNYLEFGGRTSCACITDSSGERLIIDAGTGLHSLGGELARGKEPRLLRLHILLTHFHLDHIIGIPFFPPLFSGDTEIIFYSFTEPEMTQRNLRRLMSGAFFPVKFKETAAKKAFKKVSQKGFRIGDIKITSCPLVHPQGSVAYKLEKNGRSVVFATDTEHPGTGMDERLVDFVQGAACLVYDAMFTPQEYDSGRRGWGHSTWLEGTRIARRSGVQKLLLSHMNPDHSDTRVRAIRRLAQKEFPGSDCAREGMRLKF